MIHVLIQTLGGLGLFVLGMKLMTEGLQMAAGNRIRNILKAVSDNRLVGFATGAAVTAMVQSSSATTVMLISFVSAGLMTLTQAVGVILGCNVGTTMTAQLIAFKLSDLALPAIAIGVPLNYFGTRKKYRYLGEIILGFGLFFFGMTVMGDGLKPLRSDPAFISFSAHPPRPVRVDDPGGGRDLPLPALRHPRGCQKGILADEQQRAFGHRRNSVPRFFQHQRRRVPHC